MKINTKVFGEIEISEDKIIIFQDGIIGFPDLKRFALLHDMERGDNVGIRFLQSLEEPGFAMPVPTSGWSSICGGSGGSWNSIPSASAKPES